MRVLDDSSPRLCFEVLTLFPQLFAATRAEGLIGKAVRTGLLGIETTDFREFAVDRHRSVDDLSFGGGAGMLISPRPVVEALEQVEAKRGPTHRIVLTPSGQIFDQAAARRLAEKPRIALICGRYEGIDDRVREHFADESFSIGDFVLNGGEVAALALIEAIGRLVPGVVGNPESLAGESFADPSLLEHPQYTRPETFRGHAVPEILRGGDHRAIERWRRWQALHRTWQLREELVGPRLRQGTLQVQLAVPESSLREPGWSDLKERCQSSGTGLSTLVWRSGEQGGPTSDLRRLRRRFRREGGGRPSILVLEAEFFACGDSDGAGGSDVQRRSLGAALEYLCPAESRSPACLGHSSADAAQVAQVGPDVLLVVPPAGASFAGAEDGLGTLAAEPDLRLGKIPVKAAKGLALRSAIEHPSQPTETRSPLQLALNALNLLDQLRAPATA